MPLWSNEEWRARIGSSWCALGRFIKSKSSGNQALGPQLSGETLLLVVSKVVMLALLFIGLRMFIDWIIGSCTGLLLGK